MEDLCMIFDRFMKDLWRIHGGFMKGFIEKLWRIYGRFMEDL